MKRGRARRRSCEHGSVRADRKTSGWARAVRGHELAGLVDALGSPLAAVKIVTRLPSPAHTHASFRLVLAS